jgi:putative addiction module component (TIGR02574 family)
VFADALALPGDERVRLVRELSDSLLGEAAVVGEQWPEEITRRLEAVERGEVELVPWEVVRERLQARRPSR